jgi:hypothetical protein
MPEEVPFWKLMGAKPQITSKRVLTSIIADRLLASIPDDARVRVKVLPTVGIMSSQVYITFDDDQRRRHSYQLEINVSQIARTHRKLEEFEKSLNDYHLDSMAGQNNKAFVLDMCENELRHCPRADEAEVYRKMDEHLEEQVINYIKSRRALNDPDFGRDSSPNMEPNGYDMPPQLPPEPKPEPEDDSKPVAIYNPRMIPPRYGSYDTK